MINFLQTPFYCKKNNYYKKSEKRRKNYEKIGSVNLHDYAHLETNHI